MKQARTNIRELLRAAQAQDAYAHNSKTYLYALPKNAFHNAKNYLLKVRFDSSGVGNYKTLSKEQFEIMLAKTSALTPVSLESSYNFGQPLLKSEVHGKRGFGDFQIVRKVPCKTLSRMKTEMGKEGYQNMLRMLPDETYKKFLEELAWLIDHGLHPDLTEGNILLDNNQNPPVLHNIDVLNGFVFHSDKDRVERIKRVNMTALLSYQIPFSLMDAQTHIRIERIAAAMHFPKDDLEMEARILQKPIVFASVSHIKHLGQLSLDDTPKALAHMLKNIEQHSAMQL